MLLPRSPAEITPAWLTEALSIRNPGLVVDSCNIVNVISGACTKVRIALSTNVPDFPPTLLMKAGFEDHSASMKQMHLNEMHAYRDFVPSLGVTVPHCHCAVIDADGWALVVLEDLALAGAEFLSLQHPVRPDEAQRFLSSLARIHSRWWNSPALRDGTFGWLPDTSEARFHHYFNILNAPDRFASFAALPRCAAMPRSLVDPVRIRAAHAAMRDAHRVMPLTIIHGDAHLGNLYRTASGKSGFLDWQPRLAPWSIDVSYFITVALDLEDRRRSERHLLGHYLDQLRSLGIDTPDFDSAWTAYRRDIAWGLLIWMLNGIEFQTESSNTAAATRFAMAAIDHDTCGLLGV